MQFPAAPYGAEPTVAAQSEIREKFASSENQQHGGRMRSRRRGDITESWRVSKGRNELRDTAQTRGMRNVLLLEACGADE